MRLYTLCAFLGLITFCAACIDKERDQEETDHPIAFMTLKQVQRSKPSRVEGEILNHAHYTSYGNIILLVTYYSHRDAKIGSERFTHHEVIRPGERAAYSFEIHPPPPPQQDVKDIVVTILSGQAYPW